MKYNIRFATLSDKSNIINYINKYWKKSQILNNEELFNFYFPVEGENLNFVLAEDEIGNIVGTLGFIRTNETYKKSMWGSNWHALKTEEPMLGIKLILFLINKLQVTFYGINNNPSTKHLWNYMGQIDEMSHYYRLADKNEYDIAIVKDSYILPIVKGCCRLIKIANKDMLLKMFIPPQNRKPYKDLWYISRRYFDCFKNFKYSVYGLENENHEINSILVTREVIWKSTKVLRIVDFIGIDNEFGEIGFDLQKIMDENQYEFIDLWSYGLDEKYIRKAGLLKLSSESGNIIPDKYEPLVQCNDTILVSSTDDLDEFYAFRADGDNDRPNLEII